MEPIFLIVGGPGVGKSTTSRVLAATFPRSIHIPVDDLRHMVVNGLELPEPVPSWGPELIRQITLARDAAMRMALDYAEAGLAVVLDDFYDQNHLAEYRTLLARPEAHAVFLVSTPEEARRRNAARAGEGESYIDTAIEFQHDLAAPHLDRLAADGWLILDTTAMDVDSVVAAILEHAEPAADGVGSGRRAARP
jgi:predicted kinase